MIPKTLDDAIRNHEEFVETEHPLFEMPIETAEETKGNKFHKSFPLWCFGTDNQSIIAHIYKPQEVEKIIRKIAPMYESAYNFTKSSGLVNAIFGDKTKQEDFIKALAFHNSTSLLVHEICHSLYCPDSTWTTNQEGEKVPGDRELCYQAISEGIMASQPKTTPADLVAKTKNVENAIWDFVIDTFQYSFISQTSGWAKTLVDILQQSGYKIDQRVLGELPEGVIPIFDVVSYAEMDKLPKGILSLNRYTYSLLFCSELETRKNLIEYFEPKIQKGGITNIEDLVKSSLKGLVKVDPTLLQEKRINSKTFENAVDTIYDNRESSDYDNTYLIKAMTGVLMDKRTRYDAIKGFVTPLAHLIEMEHYETRGGQGGMGGQQGPSGPNSGQPQPGSGQPGDKETNESGDGDQEGDEGAGDSDQAKDKGKGGKGNQEGDDITQVVQAITQGMGDQQAQAFVQSLGIGQGSGNNPYLQQLLMQGKDAYYKQHAPKMEIETPDLEAETFEMGHRLDWKYQFSVKVPANERHKHDRWINFGSRQNLPVCQVIVPDQLYQVNYFEPVETSRPSWQLQSTGIDVARNWIMLSDSSGSMGSNQVGSGSTWDALQHVNYAELGALVQASKMMSKNVDLWVGNFSDRTDVVGPVDLHRFYDTPVSDEKKVLLLAQGRGTTLNTAIFPRIQKQLKPGRTVWSFVTDGGISNSSAVYNVIDSLTQQKEHCVLYFDMFHQSSLGGQLQTLQTTRPNLGYHKVSDMNQILSSSIKVLVKYR
jgi:hypothetical protein